MAEYYKYDMITRWGEYENSVKWTWFIVPKQVEQINDYLFIDTCEWDKIKFGVSEMDSMR